MSALSPELQDACRRFAAAAGEFSAAARPIVEEFTARSVVVLDRVDRQIRDELERTAESRRALSERIAALSIQRSP